MWPGFTCFRCGGSGIDPSPELTKEYTPERRAQLDAINERRRAKKHAEFLAKVPQINAEYCEKHGLNGEFIYIPKGNTFEIKDELKEMGVWTFAAEADGEDCRSADFNCPCAIVLGSEGEGVSRLVREKCDYTVSIPMRGGVNSLNVSTAAAVLLYEAANKQGK